MAGLSGRQSSGEPEATESPEYTGRSLSGVLVTLKLLGTTGLLRQISWLSFWSLVAGLSQAALLVIVSETAVSSVQSHHQVSVEGLRISTDGAILASFVVLVVYAVSSLISALASTAMSRRSLEAGRDRVIEAFFRAAWAVQSAERLGHVQQLLTVNCENIGNILLSVASGLQCLLFVLTLLTVAFVVNPVSAILVLTFGLLLFVLLRPLNKLAARSAWQLSSDSQAMATGVTEYTRLAREIRIHGVEDLAIGKMRAANRRAASSFQKNRNLIQLSPVAYQSFALGFLIAGMAVLVRSQTGLASTGAVLLLILRSLSYGSGVQSMVMSVSGFKSYLDQIAQDMIRYETCAAVPPGDSVPQKYDVVVDHVSFSYDENAKALQNLCFEIECGQVLGVVGRSGSGKTTLSQILLGMRRPSEGKVLIGDQPVWRIAMGGGRSPVAIVAQEPVLLQGSIASNIAFFRDSSRQQIESAARAAHIHDEIISMPNGYDTAVGEGGGSLSGGQRQRLAIARALLGSPKLLVLDEPTSALDGRSESLIRTTLAELRGRMTVVVISHRLAAIEDCDALLVLEDGKMADFGPSDMVRKGSAFQQVLAAAEEEAGVVMRAREVVGEADPVATSGCENAGGLVL